MLRICSDLNLDIPAPFSSMKWSSCQARKQEVTWSAIVRLLNLGSQYFRNCQAGLFIWACQIDRCQCATMSRIDVTESRNFEASFRSVIDCLTALRVAR